MARRILRHLASQAEPESGMASVTKRNIARHQERSQGKTFRDLADLELAGLVRVERDDMEDLRHNRLTLAGADPAGA